MFRFFSVPGRMLIQLTMKVEETSVCFLALDAKYKSRLNHSINITFQHEINLTLYCA